MHTPNFENTALVELADSHEVADYMRRASTFNREVSDSTVSVSSSSGGTTTWNGFLIERFPEYGTEEFKLLKEVAWPRYGLDKERIYNHMPEAPDWFALLKKEVKQELMNEILKEQRRLVKERKDDCTMEEPTISRETIARFISLTATTRRSTVSLANIPTAAFITGRMSISVATKPALESEMSGSSDILTVKTAKFREMKELTKYVWEKNWLLFKECSYPKLWADLIGDKENAISIYLNGIDAGEKLNGTWGLILNEALQFEQSFEKREDNWHQMRRYQNLDGSEIRPVMTVYREMRDVLEQEETELMDVFFGTLPPTAFPKLNPSEGFYRKGKSKSHPKKRPLSLSVDVVMLSDISTVNQRFTCMFEMEYSWRQSVNGGRNYYIKEQLDELDEMSTNKEKVFKAEWKPPEPILKNAVSSRLIKETSPHIRDQEYNTLYSTMTFRATFSEKMELENFPFDCQELNMSMEIRGNDFALKGKNENFIKIDWGLFALDEWQPSKNAVDCTIEIADGITSSNNIVIAFKIQRDPSNYIYKLAITSFMIVTGTFLFSGIANDDIADRLNYIATMFLTGQAFQMVASSETPSLGYLSMIDYFLVIGNLFIYIQFAVAIFINFRSSQSHPKDIVNLSCLGISAGLYTIFIIGWIIWARVISIPTEATKLNATKLDLYSEGFIYIITYLKACDGSKGEHHFTLPSYQAMLGDGLEESFVQGGTEQIMFPKKSPRGKLATKNRKKTKISQIVGKRIDDDGHIFQALSGRNLIDAIERRRSQLGNMMQHPIWKEKDTYKIKAKKLRSKSRKSLQKLEAENSQSAVDSPSSGEVKSFKELKEPNTPMVI